MELSPRVAQTASNVLECKIAFRTDARIGDRFEILFEETVYLDSVDGVVTEHVLPGRTDVLFVSYSGERAGKHRAYWYFDGDKSSHNAHYTEEGEALIFSGLRYPLDRIHITSSYGPRRHPVTGQRSMHHGVDYRASVGTPVYAVAEGRVTKSAYDANSGHYVAIKHNDNTTSYYLHLNRRSVSVGANVKARQVIGQSGNTGLSSGPHLHFGVKQANGTWMNPLSKRMIATPKLSGEKLEMLKEQIEEIKEIYSELDV
jgi:murein DD-endopeptidase MepM/ murein hydrolase activator NlpD